MRQFLRFAADALALGVKRRIALDAVKRLRTNTDLDQAQVDTLQAVLGRYEEKPNQRTADMLAKAVYRLINDKVFAQRGSPADEYLSYVEIRMEREMDPRGAFEALARKPSRAR